MRFHVDALRVDLGAALQRPFDLRFDVSGVNPGFDRDRIGDALDAIQVAQRVLGGITLSVDWAGRLRWVRKHVAVPAEDDPRWVLQRYVPPLVQEGRMYVTQPGVRTVACLDPATGRLVDGDVQAQTRRVFENLEAVLDASGKTFDQVIKVNVYLTDMRDFAAMNEVYATQFSAPFPARTTVAVAALPLGARVEIELVAR